MISISPWEQRALLPIDYSPSKKLENAFEKLQEEHNPYQNLCLSYQFQGKVVRCHFEDLAQNFDAIRLAELLHFLYSIIPTVDGTIDQKHPFKKSFLLNVYELADLTNLSIKEKFGVILDPFLDAPWGC